MRIVYFIIPIALNLLHVSCDNSSALDEKIEDNYEASEVGFFRQWESIENEMPLKAILEIDSLGTFHYALRGEHAQGFSSGGWVILNDYIVLTSSHSDSCLYVQEFGKECMEMPNPKNPIESIGTTIPKCAPLSHQTIHIKFDEDSFLLHHDTLIHAQKIRVYCPVFSGVFVSKE